MATLMVLKNFKEIHGKAIDEFPALKIRYDDEEVFADLPVCKVPYGHQMVEPYLMLDNQRNQVAIEKVELLKLIEPTKIFFLKKGVKETDQQLIEVERGKHDVWARLPKDTDVKELALVNGQIMKIEKDVPETNKKGESGVVQ